MARDRRFVLSGHMDKEQQTQRRIRTWIVCRDPQTCSTLVDLSRLALMRPMVLDPDRLGAPSPGVAPGDILLVEVGCDVSGPLETLARVTVARSGTSGEATADIHLPGDEVALLQLLSARAESTDTGDRQPTARALLVGAWNGGGGATTVAHRLARASRAVLLDAAGNRGGAVPLEDAVSWEDLAVDDLPSPWRLVASLPRLEGVPTLTHRHRRPVDPGDQRVREVAGLLDRSVIIDCGVSVDGLFDLHDYLQDAGKRVGTVLVGTADDRGAAALGRWHATGNRQREALYLVNGRIRPAFHAVSARYEIKWKKSPKAASARGWQKMREYVWA